MCGLAGVVRVADMGQAHFWFGCQLKSTLFSFHLCVLLVRECILTFLVPGLMT